MRRNNLDLIGIVIIALLNVMWASLPYHFPLIGMILALPLVLLLPGYALTETVFHKQLLGSTVRLVLSIGLSLAIVILGGLILNLLPAGLQALSWTALLALLTTMFCFLAAYLRRSYHPLYEPPLLNNTQPQKFHISFYQCLLFGISIIVATLSLLYSIVGAVQQPYPGFTQLWLLPKTPTGQGCVVSLGVQNFESTSMTYRITMTMDQAPINSWPLVTLKPQQEWSRVVPITTRTPGNTYVQVQLYQLKSTGAVYREVHVMMNNCSILPFKDSVVHNMR